MIIDNLSNSTRDVVKRIERISNTRITFYEGDVTVEAEVRVRHMNEAHDFVGVIHFAGYKVVGESVQQPVMY
ncbi:hypothetical protein [Mangrovibacillus cuniculi]|uniref:hypothetical protein n=1 Tax=Mangrovibacillus cuniculi TaxID=2593652 RepID=UPI001EFA183B|nr:hypothetical protein [Mangrovibacillus cuniculi]